MYRFAAFISIVFWLLGGMPLALSYTEPEPMVVSDPAGLADAIIQANDESGHPGPDTIVLEPGTYELTQPDPFPNPDGPSGLPPITSTIVIDGQGQSLTRSLAAPAFRILHIDLTGDLTLKNITISNGNNITAGTEGDVRNGAGVLNRGTFTCDNCTITGNIGHSGGALRNMGTATIIGSRITGNTANFGGGISNRGALIVQDTEITENDAGDGGGGVWSASGGTVILDHCTVSGNTAVKDAGGIRNDGTLTIRNNSHITRNSAGRDGGGIKNTGEDSVLDIDATCSVTDNIADSDKRQDDPEDSAGDGGGIWNADGGTVNNAGAVTGNVCYNASIPGCGGGIFTPGAGILNNRGTISGNYPDQIMRWRWGSKQQ